MNKQVLKKQIIEGLAISIATALKTYEKEIFEDLVGEGSFPIGRSDLHFAAKEANDLVSCALWEAVEEYSVHEIDLLSELGPVPDHIEKLVVSLMDTSWLDKVPLVSSRQEKLVQACKELVVALTGNDPLCEYSISPELHKTLAVKRSLARIFRLFVGMCE